MQTLSVLLTTGQSDSFSGATFVQILSWEELKTTKGTVSPVSSVVFFLPSYGSTSATSAAHVTMFVHNVLSEFFEPNLTSRGVRGGVLIVLIGHKDGITEGWSSRASGWRGMCMNELGEAKHERSGGLGVTEDESEKTLWSRSMRLAWKKQFILYVFLANRFQICPL